MKDFLIKLALAAWPYLLKFVQRKGADAVKVIYPAILDICKAVENAPKGTKYEAAFKAAREMFPTVAERTINLAIEFAVDEISCATGNCK